MIGNLFYYTNEADITDDLNDDNYPFIPQNDFLGSYWLLQFLTIFGGISFACLQALQGKYLGECSTNGPVGKYFTLNFLLQGGASMLSFILLELIFQL